MFLIVSHWAELPISELQKKKWDKSKKRVNKKWWEVCRLFSSVQGLCWAWLWPIRVLILLYLALHSCDVSNTIQNDQNEINHESDGSSWLFKPRRNDFGQGFLIQYFLSYGCVSFLQYEVQRVMLKLHSNWGSAFSSPQTANTKPVQGSPPPSHSPHILQPSWARVALTASDSPSDSAFNCFLHILCPTADAALKAQP